MQAGAFLSLPSASFTRPGDTTQYAVGDLVANNTTAGLVVPLTFATNPDNVPHRMSSGGKGMVRAATLTTSNVSLTNGSFRAHFFTRRPVPAPAITPAILTAGNIDPAPIPSVGDNAAFAVDDVTYYIGAIDITMLQAFSDGAWGKGVPNVGNELMFDLAGGNAIYALLEARAAYTPTSAGTFFLTPHIIQG